MIATTLLFVAASALPAALAAGVRPTTVPLLKCCRIGETLVESDTAPTEWMCRASDDNERQWVPLMYAPARRDFLERGRIPPHWQVHERERPACPHLRAMPTAHTAPYLLFAGNGSLLVRERGLMLSPGKYCADATGVLVCVEDADPKGPADPPVPAKCCAPRQVFDGTRCAVAASLEEETSAVALNRRGAVGAGWPACTGGGERYLVVGTLVEGTVGTDGSLTLGDAELPARGYCVEIVRGWSGARVLACEALARGGSQRHALYGGALAVGAAFLAATLAGGLLLPAAHRALHWRCQTHYVAALLLGDVLLAATQLAGDAIPPTLCRTLAVCMHFLFLSAFFWLNTMCFNIWWTFRDFRPTSLERGQEACRLRVYSAYAWGGPLVLAGTAALVDHLAAPTALRPRFGEQRCWFYGDAEILVYFFGPVGVLLCVNLALFASTTRQLTCGLWRRDDLKSTSERAALGRVCAKLVVVMGVTWAADVVSWAAGGPEYVWYVTDLLNALQGVFIFIVVGCQPQVWASVKRWSVVRACWRGSGGGAGATAPLHSSSQLPSCGESLTHTTAPNATAPPPRPPMETVC